MGKLLVLIIVLSISGIFLFNLKSNSKKENITVQTISSVPSPTQSSILEKENKSLFVPYWTLASSSNIENSYDSLIYFGISANEQGVVRNEDGYKNITRFNNLFANNNKYLTLRMLDSEANSQILKDNKIQNQIISDSLKTAKENSFQGLVLDFETQGLPFESLINRITNFYKSFYVKTKQEDLEFLITIYGDNFYRVRPYDIKELAKNSDAVLVMAYDFHKSRGNPGPNFPLEGKEIYGYDFKSMTEDFLSSVSKEKLIIVFGFFGYDWEIDDKNQSKNNTQSLSLNQIEQRFVNNCSFKDCQIKIDNKSSETKITYIDNQQNRHVVWFEDNNSVNKKIEYLKTKGINKFSFWANSYF